MSRLSKLIFARQFPSLVKSPLVTWPKNEGEAESPRGKLSEPQAICLDVKMNLPPQKSGPACLRCGAPAFQFKSGNYSTQCQKCNDQASLYQRITRVAKGLKPAP